MTGLLPPMGVFPSSGGVEVRVFSRHATAIEFCLFDKGEHRQALRRTNSEYFSGFIAGARAGLAYGFRAEGPHVPPGPHQFDRSKLLVDPLALAVDRVFQWHPQFALRGEDTSAFAPRGIISSMPARIDRAKPKPPGFIYELQAKSFSKLNPDIPEGLRGTFAALAHPASLAHFKRLGVDTIEVMPLMAWADERHLAELGLRNAWGYNPYCFGAPEPRIVPGGWSEIVETLQTLHAEGFQVILDVVFNHTGESDLTGPTLSLRGLDSASYYRHIDGRLVNDTGCGNMLAADDPAVIAMILQSLRLWAGAGFDGFRYDLATVLGRAAKGYSPDAPLLAAIAADPMLGGLIHIAEPWDIGPGGYQLGNFPPQWYEWNDLFRDDIRRFWRGDGSAGSLATRLAGSSDFFRKPGRSPSASINFVAAHDGFSLADAVRYSGKQNQANGEDNRDGHANEASWVAENPARDVRAMLATLLFSRGTPMLAAGDEFGRSQQGNNNAYAQDNEITWLDWRRADGGLIDHVAGLAALRRSLAEYFEDRFFTGEARDGGSLPDVQWLAADGPVQHWADGMPILGMAIGPGAHKPRLLIFFNRSTADITITPPPAQPGLTWPEGPLVCPSRSVMHWLEREEPGWRPSLAPDEEVRQLALAAGILPEWWEVNGTQHAVSLETQRTLLAAMGLSARTRGDVRDGVLALRMMIEDAADSRCFQHPAVRSSRLFGLSAHLYALRHDGDWGIGDFRTLAETVKATADMGGALLGLNPLHHMFPADRARVSPYQPSDRRFIDPIYIDAEAIAPGCSKPPSLTGLQESRYVDYERVWRAKDAVLRKAYKAFDGSPAFDAFVSEQGSALDEHARFECRDKPADHGYVQWLQWIADQQLADCARRAKEGGLALGLYRDLALGCAFEGGEVWANPTLYATTVSIGSPPDPFSAQGQVWNLPPFNPVQLARLGYRPYADILRANMRHAGLLRIDHVLGLARQFWVPRGASGADGAYVTMPMQKLMGIVAAESRKAKCSIIGEDLGTVPEGFREQIWAANMLSYRVLWFEQDAGGFAIPESYPRQATVCLSSHDLLPFKGWEQNVPQEECEKLRRALSSAHIGSNSFLADAHRFVARTPCAVMLVQADDLSGETEPLNVPGTDRERPNWRRRLSAASAALPSLPATQAVLAALRKEGRGA